MSWQKNISKFDIFILIICYSYTNILKCKMYLKYALMNETIKKINSKRTIVFFFLMKNTNISRHNTSINLLKTKLKTIKQIRIVIGHIPINVTYSTISIQIHTYIYIKQEEKKKK